MQKNIEWIDSLKAIGIILVVLGHAGPTLHLVNYIYSFHMPLFFFISGYLFSLDRHPQLINFVKSRARGLLIPYLTFAVMGIIIYYVTNNLGTQMSETPSILSAFWEMIVSKRNYIFFNVPIWYLTCLFLVTVIYYLLRKYIKNDLIILTILLLIGSIGFIKFKTVESLHTLPWSFDATMYYLFYYGAGNLLRIHKTKIRYKNAINLLMLVSNLIILFWQGSFEFIYSLHMPFNQNLYNYLMSIFISGCGIGSCVYVSKFIKLKPILYLGKNSLVILGLHSPLAFYVVGKIYYMLNIHFTPMYSFSAFILTILSLIVLVPVIEILNRNFPYLLGKKIKKNFINRQTSSARLS